MSSSTSDATWDLRAWINPSTKQDQAFQASLTHMFTLYGGAMGGGKSYWLRRWAIREAVRLYGKYGVPNVPIGLFSKDYPTLRDRQISRIKFEIPDWVGTLTDSQAEGFVLRLHARWGGGRIALRNLDDPSKYNSAEFGGIAVEELTENPETIFHELRKRIRWPGIPQSDMHFVAAANPGGIGHAWVKKLWIDREYTPEMKPFAHQFAYVPARAQDNPHLDAAYYDQLQSLPEDMRKAYAEGSWDIFAGQYFTEWRRDIHVVEPFRVPWFWKVRRSGDWGEAKPCAYVWIVTDPEGSQYVVREVYGAGLKVREQAQRILAVESELSSQGVTVEPVGVLDSACWDATGRAQSIAEQFADFGVRWVKATKGPNSRVAGWTRLKRLLHPLNGKPPQLRVFSNCANLVRTLPTLVHDKLRPEDLDSDGEDHAADALRYGTDTVTDAGETPQSAMTPDERSFMTYARERMREAA